MSLPFLSLSLAMLTAASAFVVWPLWRVEQAGGAGRPRRKEAMGLVVVLVLLSAGGYAWLGAPLAWRQPSLLEPVARVSPSSDSTAQAAGAQPGSQALAQVDGSGTVAANGAEGQAPSSGVGQPQIEAMVQRLAQRLQAEPDNAEGWRMLARSYETLRRFDDAVRAYQRLIALRKPDADVLVDYAVALGMSKGQTLAGEPEAVLDEALRLQPSHPQALALSGSAAFERQDYKRAISRWETLMTHMPAEAEMRGAIQANIDKARARAAQP
jgi:cytochrome c-type biogenesis protein CcmH